MKSASRPIDDDAVAEYLAANDDFFVRRPDLLAGLDLPKAEAGALGKRAGDDAGGVVPLVERQVSVLRRRYADLRGRMAELIGRAEDNDRTFANTRGFALALMEVEGLAAFDRALAQELVAAFKLDHAACLLNGQVPGGDLQHVVGVATAPLPRLFDHAEPVCGVYRAEEYAKLFRGATLTAPGSVALVPLDRRDGRPPATLALGSKEPRRFSPDKGRMFLNFLGEAVSRTLARLERGASPG